MRNATTQTISINAPYDKAFDYLANPLTQKEWAINFMKDVQKTDNGFIAVTPFGEMELELDTDKQTGIINIILNRGEPIATRLIKNEEGCEFLFTLFQPNEMPDAAWKKETVPGLMEELEQLKSILERP